MKNIIKIDIEHLMIEDSRTYVTFIKTKPESIMIEEGDLQNPTKEVECIKKYYDIIEFRHPKLGTSFHAVCKEDWKKALPIIKYWEESCNAVHEELDKLNGCIENYEILKWKWYVKVGEFLERIYKCLTTKIR